MFIFWILFQFTIPIYFYNLPFKLLFSVNNVLIHECLCYWLGRLKTAIAMDFDQIPRIQFLSRKYDVPFPDVYSFIDAKLLPSLKHWRTIGNIVIWYDSMDSATYHVKCNDTFTTEKEKRYSKLLFLKCYLNFIST